MSEAKGVIAAGHPLTAEAGAEVLRAGGNAVDAAICAVLTSFAVESLLTGFGAGGFMLVDIGGETTLIDFFVAAPGADGIERREELVPIQVYFDQTPQTFNVGAASCGVPGCAAGLALAAERFGTMPIADLTGPGIRHAREGAPLNAQQAYVIHILERIVTRLEGTRRLYAPEGQILREGEVFRFPELADALERFGRDGAGPFYDGDIGRAVAEHVCELGGTLGPADMAAYEAIERRPARACYRGTEVFTNPPPSSGGVLIAYCLDLLERLGSSEVEDVVAVMRSANDARGADFHDGLYEEGYLERFLGDERMAAAAEEIRAARSRGGGGAFPADGLGSTTHLSVLDADGNCASVTCSNGTGSGVLVPGSGVHVNNMLGEEDLNPLGFHRTPPGRRITSMMAPTIVLRDGEVLAGLGSAGSNRIRSAVLQTILRMLDDGMSAADAIEAGRLHFEADTVQAEPGVDEEGLARLEEHGLPVVRWERRNLFFGGVQAVARDPATGRLSGGGVPRRGGVALVVE
ncbi:MAG: gamma-glutamyltranspeptidase / glutathione hydrolase [Solirubrobacterales bacterium]|nr:gamma-glutamyltranspeptidase / glutathione hydrolase [Solirubrobacterales bacterium]